jgi:protein-disulfide isomerase
MQDTLLQLQREIPKLTIGVHQLPLADIHPVAHEAAEVAVCSESFGSFRAMHDSLLTTSDWFLNRDWATLALSVGIADTGAFSACLHSSNAEALLATDSALARRFSIEATPAWISRKGVRFGVLSVAELKDLVGG